MKTNTDYCVPDEMFVNYLNGLISQFFKILPIKENGEPSLNEYMRSLKVELLGNKDLIIALKNDKMYLSLIAILEYLINNDCDTPTVKREVFKSISIVKKLTEKYQGEV